MKKYAIVFVVLSFALLLSSCFLYNSFNKTSDNPENTYFDAQNGTEETGEIEAITKPIIIPEGITVMDRFKTPDGYQRTETEEFSNFLRNYPLKKAEEPVLLYDGREKGNQNAHVAVLKLPIENEDLQQCADSVMRMYAEYFWEEGEYDKILFHLSDGFEAYYTKWREGYRIGFENDKPYWSKKTGYDDSYEAFVKYMRIIFAYAGTASMESFETEETSMEELKIGDVFIKGGSPGHVVMVVDLCENESGTKAFLLAQGYMPAQEFHILKNPLHEEDPWYYEEEVSYPFRTPEYTFTEGSLRSLTYIR